jgi:hypothetical protein
VWLRVNLQFKLLTNQATNCQCTVEFDFRLSENIDEAVRISHDCGRGAKRPDVAMDIVRVLPSLVDVKKRTKGGSQPLRLNFSFGTSELIVFFVVYNQGVRGGIVSK